MLSREAKEKITGSIAAEISGKAKVNRKGNKAEGISVNGNTREIHAPWVGRPPLDGRRIIPAAVVHKTCEGMVS